MESILDLILTDVLNKLLHTKQKKGYMYISPSLKKEIA